MSSPPLPDLPPTARAADRPLTALVLLCVALILGTHAFIDLELALRLPLPGGRVWAANAPVADVTALALLPVVLAAFVLQKRRRPTLPGVWGWALMLVAGLLSVQQAIDPPAAAHHLLRKPLLVYAIYGVGLAWAVAALVPRRALLGLMVAALTLTALVSVGTSAGRILAGDTLWYHSLAGLTPNHKTLAVCLAGWLPLLMARAGPTALPQGEPERRWRRAFQLTLLLCGAAVLASLSKTAWLGAGLAVACFLPIARPLAWRPKLLLPALGLGLALAYYSPVLLRSRTMLDAARSRHSLNTRAWHMFEAHPVLGSGTGMSTRFEMVTFPHYRVNGVDAHGAIQKVGGETGLLGLAGFGLFVLGAGRGLLARWREERELHPELRATALPTYGAVATFAVLHGQLLLSTELFSPTHWVPLATAWGLSQATTSAQGGAD